MAKRVPPEEKPYHPLNSTLVHSVLNPSPLPADDQEPETLPIEQEEPAKTTAEEPSPKVLTLPKRRNETVEKAQPERKAEKREKEKRFLLTPTEDEEFERMVFELGRSMGTSLSGSHLMRAMNVVLSHVSEELKSQGQRGRPMKRPPNTDVEALAAFEHYLAQLIETAVRNSKPLK